jgi:outer membrane protein assembly factor BamA
MVCQRDKQWTLDWGRLGALALVLLVCLGGPSRARSAGPLYLERVEVRPPGAALEAAVQEQLGLWIGDRIESADLAHARERLLQSGWFEEVEVFTAPGSERGAIVLQVDATLDRGPRFESGFGQEPLDGWYLNLVGLRLQHLTRAGSTLGLTYQTGLRRRGLILDFESPRLVGPFDLLLRASGGEKDWNVFSGDVFLQQIIDEQRSGLGLRWRAAGHLRTTLWWRRGSADPGALGRKDDSTDALPLGLLPTDIDEQKWSELELSIVYDRRSVERSYRRGFYAALRGIGARPDRGAVFGRANAEVRSNLPLPGASGLSLRIAGGFVDRATPYFLRPIFGGLDSVRGYRDASLSGPFGARAYTTATAELLTPLLPRQSEDPRVLGVLFVDVGNFADADGRWGDGVVGVGWGLRLRVPWMEYIAIDAGLPLSPTGTADPFWIHLGLGVGF